MKRRSASKRLHDSTSDKTAISSLIFVLYIRGLSKKTFQFTCIQLPSCMANITVFGACESNVLWRICCTWRQCHELAVICFCREFKCSEPYLDASVLRVDRIFRTTLYVLRISTRTVINSTSSKIGHGTSTIRLNSTSHSRS
jgi:hypothetical protein